MLQFTLGMSLALDSSFACTLPYINVRHACGLPLPRCSPTHSAPLATYIRARSPLAFTSSEVLPMPAACMLSCLHIACPTRSS
jgi:hypothetical protein